MSRLDTSDERFAEIMAKLHPFDQIDLMAYICKHAPKFMEPKAVQAWVIEHSRLARYIAE